MKTATGVLLDSTERAEVARAARWIGLHPEAEAATGRKQSRRENETVRQMFASLLSSVYDGTEPIFGERLDTVRTMLNETLINAQQQVSAQSHMRKTWQSDAARFTLTLLGPGSRCLQ
jgi:hypothetical protein